MNILLLSGITFANPEIKDWPLPNEPERQRLTSEYVEHHCGTPCKSEDGYPFTMTPKMVVVHWTAGGSAKSAWNTFSGAYLNGRKDIKKGGALNVSSQFIVDRDGTIYRLLPDTRISRHCIGLNHLSIGIENVADGTKHPFTEAQVKANIELIRMLAETHPITHVIGHHEHNEMEGHEYFQELDPKYRTVKIDPGDAIMTQIRAGLSDLNLEGAYKR
jgi:hypothetical protein